MSVGQRVRAWRSRLFRCSSIDNIQLASVKEILSRYVILLWHRKRLDNVNVYVSGRCPGIKSPDSRFLTMLSPSSDTRYLDSLSFCVLRFTNYEDYACTGSQSYGEDHPSFIVELNVRSLCCKSLCLRIYFWAGAHEAVCHKDDLSR